MAELNYETTVCQFTHLNHTQMMTLAKGNKVTGSDSIELEGQFGQLVARRLILLQPSQCTL